MMTTKTDRKGREWRGNAPVEALERFAMAVESPWFGRVLARHPRASERVSTTLLAGADAAERGELALCARALSRESWERLITDASERVRHALASRAARPSAPSCSGPRRRRAVRERCVRKRGRDLHGRLTDLVSRLGASSRAWRRPVARARARPLRVKSKRPPETGSEIDALRFHASAPRFEMPPPRGRVASGAAGEG